MPSSPSHIDVPLSPKITAIESLTERSSLTWTHNTVCFSTSDIEYVVSWVDLASGGGLNGTTVERNSVRRTGMRGVSSVGGVAASWEDSGTYVQVCFLCAVCASPNLYTKCLTVYTVEVPLIPSYTITDLYYDYL